MNYTAKISITVLNAEAPDKEYLEEKAREIEQYLSHEGETVHAKLSLEVPNVGAPTITA